ncbi:putative inorganic carbon transporter subunit DabA, partial [Escherichia coli]|uniref:putative inorganic carbon transporter subunit DabA n=1 Tax=Escherichia coli TaxID=562 RepID=UPI0028DDE0A2
MDRLLAQLPPRERTQVWLEAYEENYRGKLLATIDRPATADSDRPSAQLVCCIDVRSEGLRRRFEER